MIKIKKTELQGFGSIVGPEKFKWNRKGLNVIIGLNGAGKTTWLSGLMWTLYGKSLKSKNIKMWEHKRPKAYQGVYGSTVFEKDGNVYTVIRCLDYKGEVYGSKGNNRLVLLENGVPSDIRDKIPLQAEINRIIGYSQDLFLNTVMFGQGMKRIIEETGPNKKKVFEEAFESGFIREGKDKVDKEIKRLTPLSNEAYITLSNTENKIETLKTTINLIKEQEREFNERRDNKIAALTEKQTRLGVKLSYQRKAIKRINTQEIKKSLKKLQIKISKVNKAGIKKLEDDIFRQENLIENLRGHGDNLLTRIQDKTNSFKTLKKRCNVCGAKLSKEKIGLQQAIIKGSITDLKEQVKGHEAQIRAQISVLEEMKEKLSSISSDKTNITKLKDKEKHYEAVLKTYQVSVNNLNTYKEQIEDLKAEINEYREEVYPDKLADLPMKLKKEKKARKNQRKLYKSLKRDIEDLSWISGDVLGNKGLRAYIFDTMLKGLNSKLLYYQQYAGYRVEFNVDLDSANKDIYTLCYDGEHMIDYEDLSGGQKKTVDICTAFAIHDLVSGDKPINLMVFDEVFDSLDAEHIDLVYELISEKSQGKSVYLITHNLELQNSSDKVIRMSLDSSGHTVLKTLSA